MLPETVFDLASISKVFSTAALTALLVDRAWLEFGTPVKAVFPDYPYGDIQVKHLLSHTAGFVAWEPYWERLRERFAPLPVWEVSVAKRQRAMRELIFAVKPEAKPGERVLYSDVSALLLGFLLEEVTRMPLDRAVSTLLWQPLGVQSASYRRVDRGVDAGRDEAVAATEQCAWRGGVVQGQVHDDNCWAMGGYAGHAGVFGTARDVLHFSARLLGGFISREVLKASWTRVSQPAGCERTLGWDTPSGPEPSASLKFSSRTVGHLGFTGTALWIDPAASLAVTLLTNRVHPSRDNNNIRAFRPRFFEAVRLDLGF
jgi:serine-type D-Ala-D-Ala carboxypeptidase